MVAGEYNYKSSRWFMGFISQQTSLETLHVDGNWVANFRRSLDRV